MTPSGKLLLHPRTTKQAESLVKNPVNALLILGSGGSGKASLGYKLAARILGLDSTQKLLNYPYFRHIKKPETKQDIPIEAIRELVRMMTLKTLGIDNIRRAVLIEDAQNLSLEAQNALLKMLEEPQRDTIFILTATNAMSLLPTITSRCQRLTIYPVNLQQASGFYGQQYDTKALETAWQLSQGSPALLNALLTEEQDHPLKQAVTEAKSFLGLTPYERLIKLDGLVGDKDAIKFFLEAMAKIITALNHKAVADNRREQAQKLLKSRRVIQQSAKALDGNSSPKLVALNLVLNLRI